MGPSSTGLAAMARGQALMAERERRRRMREEEAAFNAQYQTSGKPTSLATMARSMGEAGLGVGADMALGIPAAGYGIYQGIRNRSVPAGMEAAKQVQDYAYEPRSAGGKSLKEAYDTLMGIPSTLAEQGVTGLTGSETAGQLAGLAAGMVGPGRKGPGKREIFADVTAKKADLGALERGKELLSKGADQQQVWRETGWWIPDERLGSVNPPGGRPLWEIKDPVGELTRRTPTTARAATKLASDARMMDLADQAIEAVRAGKFPDIDTAAKALDLPAVAQVQARYKLEKGGETGKSKYLYQMAENAHNRPVPAPERMAHPELYENYPQLRQARIGLDEEKYQRGAFDPQTQQVDVSRVRTNAAGEPIPATPQEMWSTAIHEMGHGVQSQSPTMPRGGSPATARAAALAAFRRGDISHTQFVELDKMSDFDIYQRIGGEALSRLAQKRLGSDYSRFPGADLDVPASEIFTPPKDGRSLSTEKPTLAQVAQGGPLLLTDRRSEIAANQAEREKAWRDLERSRARAGTHMTAGNYTGAPQGYNRPEQIDELVNQYANRITTGLDEGLPRGYFYGDQALANVSDTPEAHLKAARVMAPTSAKVGPDQNLGFTWKALNQDWAGEQINTTMYPNARRRSVEDAIAGLAPFGGYKIERYGPNLLGPPSLRDPNPLASLPPKDQWEGLAVGFPKGHVPSGPAQVAWADMINERGTELANRRLMERANDPLQKNPLSPAEGQELHWAVMRAQSENRPIQLNPGDTVSGSMPNYMFNETFEPQWGKKSGVRLGEGYSPEQYAKDVAGVMLDPQGKDKLARAMGWQYQLPATQAVGAFEGQYNPAFVLPSPVDRTITGGIGDAAKMRVDAIAAARQAAFGQDARAGNLPIRRETATPIGKQGLWEVNTGAPPDAQTMRTLQEQVQNLTNKSATVVPTASGYRILNTGAETNGEFKQMPNRKFAGVAQQLAPEGKGMDWSGIYAERQAGPGGQTNELLRTLDEANPAVRQRFDAPESRAMWGQIGDLYDRLSSEGKLIGADAYQRLTRAIQSKGIEGARELVRQGLAPAAVLAILGGGAAYQLAPQQEPQS